MYLNIIKKVRISYQGMGITVIGVLLAFGYFQPQFLTEKSNVFFYLSNGVQGLLSSIIVGIAIVRLVIQYSPLGECFQIYVWLILSVLLVVPIIKDNNVSAYLFVLSCIAILSIPLVFQKSVWQIVLGINLYLALILFINFFCVLLFPDGLYNIGLDRKFYFFGHCNGAIKYIIPGIVLSAVNDYHTKGKLSVKTYLIGLSSFFVLLFTRAYTGLIGFCILFVVFIFLRTRKKIVRWMGAIPAFIISFSLYLAMMSSVVIKWINYVAAVLSRSNSIRIRYQIWEQAQNVIFENPFWGYGFISNYKNYLKIGNYYPSSAHNFFLDVEMNVGYIGLFLIILFFSVCFYRLDCIQKDFREVSVIISGIWSVVIMWNFEPWFNGLGLYGFLLTISLINILEREKRSNEMQNEC